MSFIWLFQLGWPSKVFNELNSIQGNGHSFRYPVLNRIRYNEIYVFFNGGLYSNSQPRRWLKLNSWRPPTAELKTQFSNHCVIVKPQLRETQVNKYTLMNCCWSQLFNIGYYVYKKEFFIDRGNKVDSHSLLMTDTSALCTHVFGRHDLKEKQ